MTYGPWRVAWFCVFCDAELARWHVTDSDGLCPKCGVKHPDAETVVRTNERVRRQVWDWGDAPWWKRFGDRPWTWEYKGEEPTPVSRLPRVVGSAPVRCKRCHDTRKLDTPIRTKEGTWRLDRKACPDCAHMSPKGDPIV